MNNTQEQLNQFISVQWVFTFCKCSSSSTRFRTELLCNFTFPLNSTNFCPDFMHAIKIFKT
ncbi:hypothetical protein T4B_14887 [Trichinella pseudospiralis]|uniref:Uncharacterized protein n=1 Tax=Trichinella pseudospiralis TaxID=6337 RepID=A0A0V1E8K6_TRIPS|nr:hypothetical protein T4A_11339 [Trichinella pseudospiralis]KRZ27372.1 hypothetical protein T4B_14887 [Trichinella pseudospiralis]